MPEQQVKALNDYQNPAIEALLASPAGEKLKQIMNTVCSVQRNLSALANSEEGIMAADNIVKQMSQADDNWYTQFSVYKAQCDQNTSLYNARQEGLKEGLQKGLQQGMKEGETKKAIESARKMLQKEYSPGDISEITGLPLDHVLELQKKNPEKR